MAYAFDTCILIDVLRDRREGLRTRVQALADRAVDLHLSVVAFHELVVGAAVSARPDYQRERVMALSALFRVEPWTSEDAITAATLRADLRRRGETIGLADSLIAGQALNRGWTLVTSNIREFERVPDLILEDWSV